MPFSWEVLRKIVLRFADIMNGLQNSCDLRWPSSVLKCLLLKDLLPHQQGRSTHATETYGFLLWYWYWRRFSVRLKQQTGYERSHEMAIE